MAKVYGVLPQSGAIPDSPTNLRSEDNSPGNTTIVWDASATIGVDLYQIYRDSVPIGTSQDTSFTDTTSLPSVTYSYQVQAINQGAGLASPPSAPLNVTVNSNANPVWDSDTTPQNLVIGQSYSLDLRTRCVDPEGSALSFSLVSGSLPQGVTLLASNLQGVPTSPGASTFLPDPGFDVQFPSTPAHGNLMTITRASGSFGAHADYNVGNYTWQGHNHLMALFWDIESAASANDFVRRGVGYNLDGSVNPNINDHWYLDTTKFPTNLTKSARRNRGNGAEQGGLQWFPSSAQPVMYSTFKFRLGANRQAGKFWRPYLAGGANIYNSTGCENIGWRAISENFPNPGININPNTPTPVFTPEVWQRVESWIDCPNSTYQGWVAGFQAINSVGATGFPSGTATNHTIDIGHMVDTPGASDRCTLHPSWDGDEGWADWVNNFTRNRFEIANSSTWAGRTKFEIQVPTIWSTTNVTCAINRGEHSSLSGKWLYHLDTNNTATRIGQFV